MWKIWANWGCQFVHSELASTVITILDVFTYLPFLLIPISGKESKQNPSQKCINSCCAQQLLLSFIVIKYAC